MFKKFLNKWKNLYKNVPYIIPEAEEVFTDDEVALIDEAFTEFLTDIKYIEDVNTWINNDSETTLMLKRYLKELDTNNLHYACSRYYTIPCKVVYESHPVLDHLQKLTWRENPHDLQK